MDVPVLLVTMSTATDKATDLATQLSSCYSRHSSIHEQRPQPQRQRRPSHVRSTSMPTAAFYPSPMDAQTIVDGARTVDMWPCGVFRMCRGLFRASLMLAWKWRRVRPLFVGIPASQRGWPSVPMEVGLYVIGDLHCVSTVTRSRPRSRARSNHAPQPRPHPLKASSRSTTHHARTTVKTRSSLQAAMPPQQHHGNVHGTLPISCTTMPCVKWHGCQ